SSRAFVKTKRTMNTWSGSRFAMKMTHGLAIVLVTAVWTGLPLHAQQFDPLDLQGVWTNPTITPFERPPELASKEFLTEREVKELEARAAQNRVDRPPQPGDTGSYNQFWFDSGTKAVKTGRTSLVIEPKNGRVPVKPEAEAKRDYDAAHNADSYEHMSV